MVYVHAAEISTPHFAKASWDKSERLKNLFPILSETDSNAGVEGIEPPSNLLERSILPLNYTPWCAHPELNWDQWFRKPLLYPLSYGRNNIIFYHRITNFLPHRHHLLRQMILRKIRWKNQTNW